MLENFGARRRPLLSSITARSSYFRQCHNRRRTSACFARFRLTLWGLCAFSASNVAVSQQFHGLTTTPTVSSLPHSTIEVAPQSSETSLRLGQNAGPQQPLRFSNSPTHPTAVEQAQSSFLQLSQASTSLNPQQPPSLGDTATGELLRDPNFNASPPAIGSGLRLPQPPNGETQFNFQGAADSSGGLMGIGSGEGNLDKGDVEDGNALTNNPDSANSESAKNGEDDELDSLLKMADKDMSQLSNVKVTRTTTAPSLQTEVTTVARQKSTIGKTPAAVFVISNEMIQRSGARSVPEVLRMAPGVQVSRIDANKWAVSIRGSNGQFVNKLLVQIDGRSVYTPLFGGTFWDVQDLLLEDVERIEVIRGPGASVWGANAVNGVINVITKNAMDTHGVFAEAGAGTEERGFASARYGWKINEDADMRVYGKWFERDGGVLPGQDTHDDWRVGRTGFRADWRIDGASTLTVQGDGYLGTAGNENVVPSISPPYSRSVPNDTDLEGGNALVRYTQTLSDDSEWSLQTYYDRTGRALPTLGFNEVRDTFDIDFQHRFKWMERHSLIWGTAYRNTSDKFNNAPMVIEMYPNKRSDELFSCFVQDEIAIVPETLFFTGGAKFLHSDYTGFEFQPTTRLLWTPTDHQSVWASYSRAVRLPTRAGADVRITMRPSPSMPGVYPVILGSRDYVSENLDAWEIGYRVQATEKWSWDLATFYFDYGDVQSNTIGAPVVSGTPPITTLPMTFANDGDGYAYGFELASNYELREWWRLYGAYTLLHEHFYNSSMNVGNAPNNQIYLQSSWDLQRNISFDAIARYMDELEGAGVPAYTTMDLRVAWSPNKNLQWVVAGRNLLDSSHPEFTFDPLTGNVATNVQREVYSLLTLRY